MSFVGPVEVDFHGDPAFSWTAAADARGHRAVEISGRFEWATLDQLVELAENPHRVITIGDYSGVLEPLWFDDEFLRQLNGWHLIVSADAAPDQQASLGGDRALVSATVSTVRLRAVRPIVVRSARALADDFSIASKELVAQPFWGFDADGEPFQTAPGGTAFARDYDPRTASLVDDPAANRKLRLHTDSVAALAETVFPSVAFDGNPPNFIAQRGQDCRAYDRRAGRHVWGPGHAFLQTSDCLFSNGIVRGWVGATLGPPYVHVQAVVAGVWRDVGVVSFEQTAADQLQGVRLVRCTPDVVTVALDVRDHGPVLVTLKRGERMLRVQDGTHLAPLSIGGHYARWRGMPPWLYQDGTLANAAARFGQGLNVDGLLRFAWPAALSVDAWSFGFWWKPDAASAAQVSSGLLGVNDSVDQVGRVYFDTADDTIKFVLGATTLSSAPLSWNAGELIGVAIAFDTGAGMALTTKVHTAAPVTVLEPAGVDPGTSEQVYASFDVGSAWDGVTTWGSGAWGDGTWGGAIAVAGVLDNMMLFEDRLTDTERATLLTATTALGGLPSPLGRLVWHAAFDARPTPLGSLLATGRRYEATVENGATRNADADGFTKAIALLDSSVVAVSPFGVGSGGELLEAALFLATTGTLDDLADQHSQYVTASEQEIRIRG